MRYRSGGKADNQIAAFPIGGTQGRFGIRAADRVIDHIGAFAAAFRFDLIGKGFLLVAGQFAGRIQNRLIGAALDTDIEFFLARGGSDNFRPHRLAQAQPPPDRHHPQRPSPKAFRPV